MVLINIRTTNSKYNKHCYPKLLKNVNSALTVFYLANLILGWVHYIPCNAISIEGTQWIFLEGKYCLSEFFLELSSQTSCPRKIYDLKKDDPDGKLK